MLHRLVRVVMHGPVPLLLLWLLRRPNVQVLVRRVRLRAVAVWALAMAPVHQRRRLMLELLLL